MGAPKQNVNRLRHGKYGFLQSGMLPAGARYIGRRIIKFSDFLTTTMHERTGEVSVYAAALIQTACRHESRASLLTKWLRDEKDLPLNERLAVLKEIGNASDSRDKCLKSLGLDQAANSDPWRTIDAAGRAIQQGQPEAADEGPGDGVDAMTPIDADGSEQPAIATEPEQVA